MGIAAEDLDIANRIAARLVAVGEGRVRRVAMIGSRALGLARPGSDLDIVALLEPPATAPPWNTRRRRSLSRTGCAQSCLQHHTGSTCLCERLTSMKKAGG
jgi:hypothetical protein